MRIISQRLVNVNISLFSLVVWGCGGFSQSYFANESLQPAKELRPEMLKESFEKFREWSGDQKTMNKYIQYAGKPIKVQRLKVTNPEQDFLNLADQLYNGKDPNILSQLFCLFITILKIVDCDEGLTPEEKQEKINKAYKAFLSILDYVLAKNLGLPFIKNKNSIIPQIDPTYRLFDIESLIKELQEKNPNCSEIYHMKFSCGECALPCDDFYKILAQFMISSEQIMTVKEVFKTIGDHSGEASQRIKTSCEKALKVNNFTNIYECFSPLIIFEGNSWEKRDISCKEFMYAMNQIEKNQDSLIQFSSIFEIVKKFGVLQLLIKDSQSVFEKQSSSNDTYKFVLNKSIYTDNFQTLNEALALVCIAQKVILDVFNNFFATRNFNNWDSNRTIGTCEDIAKFLQNNGVQVNLQNDRLVLTNN